MLVVNTKEIFMLNLHQNRVHFPAERNAFVLDHQHGRRDVTCKPAIIIKTTYPNSPRAYIFRRAYYRKDNCVCDLGTYFPVSLDPVLINFV